MDHGTNVVAEQQHSGTLHNKKNQVKVPKKIHKAEREKLKRDQLNELFLELGNALDAANQNNGKASILADTTRILRDLIQKVQSLRKENVALTTESHYVTAERNELLEENLMLESAIKSLSNELKEKHSTSHAVHVAPSDIQLSLPAVSPFFAGPYCQDLPLSPPKPAATQVKRPHARYPTPMDLWPLEILSRNSRSESGD